MHSHELGSFLSVGDGLFAYFGLGPGVELLPYFFALIGFMGAAFLAVVQWPLQWFWRLVSRKSAHDVAAPEERRPDDLKGDDGAGG